MAVINTGNSDPQKRISDIRPPRRPSRAAAVPASSVTSKIAIHAEPVSSSPRKASSLAMPRAKLPLNKAAISNVEGSKPSLPSAETKEIERMDQAVVEFFTKKPIVEKSAANIVGSDPTISAQRKAKIETQLPDLASIPARPSAGADLKLHFWRPNGRSVSLKTWLWLGSSIGALVAVTLLLSTVFARVFINIRPLVETLVLPPVTLRVLSGAQALDVSKGILPGEYIEFSDTRSFDAKATGKKVVSTKARGTIIITNAFGSDPQVLIATTRFMTKDGKIFRLEKGITVPGAKVQGGVLTPATIAATVIADQSGPTYNIGPADFTIPGLQGSPKYKGFSGKSTEAFSGGASGESVVATDSDIKKATESATAEMFSVLRESSKSKAPQGFKIIEGARQIALTEPKAPAVNAPGENFKIEVTGKVQAIAFRESDEADLIAALFSTSTSRTLITGKSALERKSIALDLTKKELSYVVGGSIALGSKLDGDAIARELAGKSAKAVTNRLETIPGIEAYKIKFFPVWLWDAPADQSKVRVTIEPFQ